MRGRRIRIIIVFFNRDNNTYKNDDTITNRIFFSNRAGTSCRSTDWTKRSCSSTEWTLVEGRIITIILFLNMMIILILIFIRIEILLIIENAPPVEAPTGRNTRALAGSGNGRGAVGGRATQPTTHQTTGNYRQNNRELSTPADMFVCIYMCVCVCVCVRLCVYT